MKGSVVSATNVKFDTPTEVTLSTTVKFSGGDEESDVEKLTKHEGVWYLRLKKIPETAAKLRQALFPGKVKP